MNDKNTYGGRMLLTIRAHVVNARIFQIPILLKR